MGASWAYSEVPWPLPVEDELKLLQEAVDEAVEAPQAVRRHRDVPRPSLPSPLLILLELDRRRDVEA